MRSFSSKNLRLFRLSCHEIGWCARTCRRHFAKSLSTDAESYHSNSPLNPQKIAGSFWEEPVKFAGRRAHYDVPVIDCSNNSSPKGALTMISKLNRKSLLKFTALLFAVGLLCVGAIKTYSNKADVSQSNQQQKRDDDGDRDGDNDGEKYLFVWAGDQGRTNPDFLAVVNFDERSRDYGQVVTTVPLPGAGATGNEPHHVGLSRDGRVLACGGLLSILKGQPEIFFFDVSNPAAPRFLSAA